MNAGLSNLATLKGWLLPASMTAATDYDAQILVIGLGTAAALEGFCNRKFARAVGFIEKFPADRTKHVVERYPIEPPVTKVEVQQVLADPWAQLDGLLVNVMEDAGLIFFYGQQGWQRGMLRLTYTGGYFFEQLEPTDVGYPTAQPAGSTALPDDLKLAWLLQCEHVWAQRDKLGINIGEKPSGEAVIRRISLLEDVRMKLQPYIRYQMS